MLETKTEYIFESNVRYTKTKTNTLEAILTWRKQEPHRNQVFRKRGFKIRNPKIDKEERELVVTSIASVCKVLLFTDLLSVKKACIFDYVRRVTLGRCNCDEDEREYCTHYPIECYVDTYTREIPGFRTLREDLYMVGVRMQDDSNPVILTTQGYMVGACMYVAYREYESYIAYYKYRYRKAIITAKIELLRKQLAELNKQPEQPEELNNRVSVTNKQTLKRING